MMFQKVVSYLKKKNVSETGICKILSEEQLSWSIEKALQKDTAAAYLYHSLNRMNFENLLLSSKDILSLLLSEKNVGFQKILGNITALFSDFMRNFSFTIEGYTLS